jgi:hypothetical protein
MSELNIREKWVYTQRPENERKFLASDMANALEVTLPTFYSLMRKLDLDNEIVKDARGRKVLVFTHDALARCREELERREKTENAKRETGRAELEAAQAEHPLVTDPNFLKLSYFPETTPACFSEVDE